MRRICDGVAAAFGVRTELDYRRGYPPTVNAPAQTALCREVAASVVGEANVRGDLRPSMGAEDFSYMLQAKPGCYLWLGNGLGEGGRMLHGPRYDFNDDILPIGASYWARLVLRTLRG